MNDLQFAFRQLLKHPGFTAVAVLTLARAGQRCCHRLEVLELLLGQSGLFENCSEGPGGNVGGVHRHVGLPTIGMPQDDVEPGLPPNDKARTLQSCQNFTSFVRHRQEALASRKKTPSAPGRLHDGRAFRRPTAARGHARPRGLPRLPTRESSAPGREHGRNNAPTGNPLPQCARTEWHSSLWSRLRSRRRQIKFATKPASTPPLGHPPQLN